MESWDRAPVADFDEDLALGFIGKHLLVGIKLCVQRIRSLTLFRTDFIEILMTNRIMEMLLRCIASLLLAGAMCTGAVAQAIDPDLAAQLLAKGLDDSSGGVKAVATGRHVDIDQTAPVPANLTAQERNVRAAKVHKLTLERACHSNNIQMVVASGVTITWRFRDGDGNSLTSVDIDQAACIAVNAPAA